MGPLFVKMMMEAFSLSGKLPRGQFFVLCLGLMIAQLPVMYFLVSTTGSPAVFAAVFNVVLLFESVLLTVLLCGIIRRVRDSGGSGWLSSGFIAALAVVVADSLFASNAHMVADNHVTISTLAKWSCLGFGACVGIMTLMPSLREGEASASL